MKSIYELINEFRKEIVEKIQSFILKVKKDKNISYKITFYLILFLLIGMIILIFINTIITYNNNEILGDIYSQLNNLELIDGN